MLVTESGDQCIWPGSGRCKSPEALGLGMFGELKGYSEDIAQ